METVLHRLAGAPQIVTDRKGGGVGANLLDTSFTTDRITGLKGINALKLRLHLDRTDWTSITVRLADATPTEMVGAGNPRILSVRQAANQGTGANAAVSGGPNDGGFTGATGTDHVFISADDRDDVIMVALGGTVDELLVGVKRTGGTAVAGNRVQIEARRVEG